MNIQTSAPVPGQIGGKTIGIIGSRSRDSQQDFLAVEAVFLELYRPGDTIVSGGCPRGGDRFAEVLAKKYNVPIKIHYADWDKYGRSAGPRRNHFIAADANVLIASPSSTSRGTQHTMGLFKARPSCSKVYPGNIHVLSEAGGEPPAVREA